MLRNNTLLKILSLLIAIFLWVYVMGEVNPETKTKISNLEVSFINTDTLADRDLAVFQEKAVTVSATIKGKRSDVNNTKSNGVTATVDVSGCKQGKNTREIVVNLPSGVSLENISDDSLKFNVEERVEEEKPVEIEFLGNGDKNNKLISYTKKVEPETVIVSGAKSSVNKITAVKGTVSKTVLAENSKAVDVVLTPVTKNGGTVFGIEMNTESAHAEVQLMSVKTVKLDISAKNVKEGMALEKLSGDDTVKIIASTDTIDSIDELPATIDLKGISSTGDVEIKIDLPEGVYLYDEENVPTATVTLKASE